MNDDIFDKSEGESAILKAMEEMSWGKAETDTFDPNSEIEKQPITETIAETDFHAKTTPKDLEETEEPEAAKEPKVETAPETPAEPEVEKQPEAAKPAEAEAKTEGDEQKAPEPEKPAEAEATKQKSSVDWAALGLDDETSTVLSGLPEEKAKGLASGLGMVKALDDIRAAYEGAYKQRGIDISQASLPQHVQTLVRLDHLAGTEPEKYAQWYVQQVGWDQAKMMEVFGIQPPAAPAAPAPAPAPTDDLDRWLTDDDEAPAQPQPAPAAKPVAPATPVAAPEKPAPVAFDPNAPTEVEQQAALARTQAMINKWQTETDADGKLLRPHLDRVSANFVALAKAAGENFRSQGKTVGKQDLDELYNTAVMMDPELRAAQIQLEMKRAEAEQTAEAAKQKAKDGEERVAKSARASRQAPQPAPGGRPTGAAPPAEMTDPTEIVKWSLEQLENRA